MQISEKIDSLMFGLRELKSNTTITQTDSENKFIHLIKAHLDEKPNGTEHHSTKLPDWVHKDYCYDPQNPRKPNMRELIAALSGDNVESLQTRNPEELKYFSDIAAELLYGLIGNNIDTRDWVKIMASNDPMTEAKIETNKALNPELEFEYFIDPSQLTPANKKIQNKIYKSNNP